MAQPLSLSVGIVPKHCFTLFYSLLGCAMVSSGALKVLAPWLLGLSLWALSFRWADYFCAQGHRQLQQQIQQWAEQERSEAQASLPPFGHWESLARGDLRLATQLLHFYQQVGAMARAEQWAQTMFPQNTGSASEAEVSFWLQVLSLDSAVELKARAVSLLRKQQPENPALLFHHYQLSRQSPQLAELSFQEKHLLAQSLVSLGETALAQEVLSS